MLRREETLKERKKNWMLKMENDSPTKMEKIEKTWKKFEIVRKP